MANDRNKPHARKGPSYFRGLWLQFQEGNHRLRGYRLRCILALGAASLVSLLFSFLSSFWQGLQPGAYLTAFVSFQLVVILFANAAYAFVLAHIRQESMTMRKLGYFIRYLLPQFGCVLVFSLVQSVLSVFLLTSAAFQPLLSELLSIAVSLVLLLLNAAVAFQIYDRQTRISILLTKAVRLVFDNWMALLGFAALLLLWTWIGNALFAGFLKQLMAGVQTESVWGIVQSGAWDTIGMLAAAYLIHYGVTAALELPVLALLALQYQNTAAVRETSASRGKPAVKKKGKRKAAIIHPQNA